MGVAGLYTSNSITQKTTKVLNLVKKESPMYPPNIVSRKEVPIKLVTMFAASEIV